MKLPFLAFAVAIALVAQSTFAATSDNVSVPSFGVNMDIPEGSGETVTFLHWANTAPQWIGLTEPDTGQLSDIIYVDPNGFLNFASDTESGGPPTVPAFLPSTPNALILETGAPQEIDQYFIATGPALPQIFVTSDVEVPEPSSLMLLAVGVLPLMRRLRH
jgi:hypothetical protein